MTARDLSTPIDLPTNEAELAACLADPMWRLSHLYKIMVKEDENDEGTIVNFKPNRAQRRFIARLWYRNLILKARQLGFTTLICILWLDHALFNSDQRCGVVAQDRDTAKVIFRDKVLFAYDQLPPLLQAEIPTRERNADEIVFANNSSVRVATSMRGGTLHRLLVSEYGKICAKYPEKATEVRTGSLQAVSLHGIAVIESTAEGMGGDFHDKTKKAQALAESGKELTPRDYRFHFYAWWMEPNYELTVRDSALVLVTREHEDYFEQLETAHGIPSLRPGQKAWYVATLEGDFNGDEQMMWREYPSYPEEAFKVSTEGTYYAKEMAKARRERRITVVPYMPGIPVHTFWDIGLNDLNALWCMQRVGLHDRFINYYENSGEAPSHYVKWLDDTGYVFGTDYLPHDGAARRITEDKADTYEQMLRRLGRKNVTIVPRVTHITTGIQMVRERFPQCWFDEKNCAKGLEHLGNYRKEWDTRLATWKDEPKHDAASNGADAFRQYAQGFRANTGKTKRPRTTNWRTA